MSTHNHSAEDEVLIERLARYYEIAQIHIEAIRPLGEEAVEAAYYEVICDPHYKTVNVIPAPSTVEESQEFFLQPTNPQEHWKAILTCMAAIEQMTSIGSELERSTSGSGYILGHANKRSFDRLQIRFSNAASTTIFPEADADIALSGPEAFGRLSARLINLVVATAFVPFQVLSIVFYHVIHSIRLVLDWVR
ncbi:hypothetical protein BJ138DRAFT_1158371 [Hygrophoropsis aurantiaca]|uniref:Uncharacterized protein n=1 Tax=Hygrophoropsis aurantiaca TaxID=72124 RepID=A0ACB8A535_9AGAM|nr:hypothetical protein BJ138DRAFT_1158371 [Hygrophoropsis aurantiaca]